MNFAFTFVIVLFLALPGMLFCMAYRRAAGRPFLVGPLNDEIVIGLVIATIMHGVWLALSALLGMCLPRFPRANIHAVLVLLSAVHVPGSDGFHDALRAISNHPLAVGFYFVSLCVTSGLLGVVLQQRVASCGWDKDWALLRWNDWYHLLDGRSHSESDVASGTQFDTYDGYRVTAVVDEYVYWGLLVDYTLDTRGNLDAVVLSEPKRRRLDEKEPVTQSHELLLDRDGSGKRINVHYLVLKYADCRNLGILGIQAPRLN